MLDDTSAGGGTLAAKVGWDGDAEVEVVGSNTSGGGSEVGWPRLQGANDLVVGSAHDGDVGVTSVGSADVKGDRNNLARSVLLDVGGVVGVLVTLARPYLTLGGVVVGLSVGDLEHTLDVAVVVTHLVIVDLLTASGLHSGTWHTGLGGGDETVTGDRGGQTGGGEKNFGGLHGDERGT